MSFQQVMEEKLGEFVCYRNLILNGETGKRNVIVERKDGSCAIINQHIDFKPIPGMLATLEDIERVTVFINGKEFEFVACQ